MNKSMEPETRLLLVCGGAVVFLFVFLFVMLGNGANKCEQELKTCKSHVSFLEADNELRKR